MTEKDIAKNTATILRLLKLHAEDVLNILQSCEGENAAKAHRLSRTIGLAEKHLNNYCKPAEPPKVWMARNKGQHNAGIHEIPVWMNWKHR